MNYNVIYHIYVCLPTSRTYLINFYIYLSIAVGGCNGSGSIVAEKGDSNWLFLIVRDFE